MKKIVRALVLMLVLALTLALFACGGCTNHVDNDPKDAKCDNCGAAVACSECIDENKDAECDVCGKDVECDECVDEDKDAVCDVCGGDVDCDVCVDEDKDAECDVCGKEVACAACVDASPKDAKCDVCGKDVACATCVDESPKDAKCDVCGKAVACATCVDASPKDAKCDVCGKDVPCGECVDEDPKDAKCDVCGKDVACDVCIDVDPRDGDCDVCGETIPVTELQLLIDGEANFQFVLPSGADIDVRRTVEQTIVRTIKTKCGVEITSVTENTSNDTEMEIEVLIGNVSSRGSAYYYDEHTLGNDGYVIMIVGSKIIINGGSEESFIDAINEFAEEILGFDGRNIDENAVMSSLQNVEVIQDDYKISSLSVNGTDMKGYTIAVDSSLKYYSDAALNIQSTLYDRTGYWLNIVSLSEATEKSVVLKHIPKVSGNDSYKITANGSQLIIECAFDNMLQNATGSFLLQKITQSRGDVNFEGTVYNQDISIVKYEDFGAVGNGKVDDFKAIYLTHEFANECGQTVVATAGKTYYIHSTDIKLDGEFESSPRSAIIQTPVIWTGANFIVDDFDLSCVPGSANKNQCTVNIFKIIPDDDLRELSITDRTLLEQIVEAGIHPGVTNIQIPKEAMNGWEGSVMIIPYNSTHKIYRRKNYGSYAGADMHEVIVLDKDGNVSEETPIAFDYTHLDKILVYRLDESTAITIEGGNFTTRATNVNIIYETTDNLGNPKVTTYGTYLNRGIYINRSFTTLKNVKHSVIDEVSLDAQTDSDGNIIHCVACYQGFYAASNANHVTLDGCQMYGRRCFQRPEGGTGGTYGIGANRVNKIVFKDCVQKNFWVTVENGQCIPAERDTPNAVPSMASYNSHGKNVKMHWGVGGTNFCKNMEYIGSTLSRFDAHEGLYNGKVIDSTVNYMAITGKGTFTVSNVEWYAEGTGYGQNSVIHLREDYGSTWDGPITITDLKAYVYTDGETQLIYHAYSNWYRGYQVAFPSLEINNIDYYNIRTFKPVAPGFEVYLVGNNQSIKATSKLHLEESHNMASLSLEDKDYDGYCDVCHTIVKGTKPCNACKDEDQNGRCDACYKYTNVSKCELCVPNYLTGYCDECGGLIRSISTTTCDTCASVDGDNYCDVCYKTIGVDRCEPGKCSDKGDGYIDIPNDFDGDGVYGNSPFLYADTHATLAKPENGYVWSGNYQNFNVVIPPEYLKIFGNDGIDTDGDGVGDGGYVFKIINTAANGNISSGTYHGVDDNMGGFFGSTKFYYDDNDKTKFFQGTDHEDQTETTTFKFYH